ncbi:hypothetical protein S40285_09977 [Stachybotrys chlorohalonatus IBT 40285]|uniref:Uncharacterized protein n=1 Tax=Stachybotrys chlorohalonatus (strain IBT 40285) TaxID=1283841 RepID=A0A084QSJ2_STAC4|nr:hypothetical protein S40285_09977 [Stachybotrys chlorohalonata IBT 40285]
MEDPVTWANRGELAMEYPPAPVASESISFRAALQVPHRPAESFTLSACNFAPQPHGRQTRVHAAAMAGCSSASWGLVEKLGVRDFYWLVFLLGSDKPAFNRPAPKVAASPLRPVAKRAGSWSADLVPALSSSAPCSLRSHAASRVTGQNSILTSARPSLAAQAMSPSQKRNSDPISTSTDCRAPYEIRLRCRSEDHVSCVDVGFRHALDAQRPAQQDSPRRYTAPGALWEEMRRFPKGRRLRSDLAKDESAVVDVDNGWKRPYGVDGILHCKVT